MSIKEANDALDHQPIADVIAGASHTGRALAPGDMEMS